jgi:uncharacterized protein YbjT (DUF2867 family)
MDARIVTVLGGTGFLGRRIVRHLHMADFSVRIGSRHADLAESLFGRDDPRLQSVQVDIHDEQSIAGAVAGAYGVVNAVSLYLERGHETFHTVHVEAAQRVAKQAHAAGVERLVHVSGLGANPASPSLYIRKRGEGELAVRAAFAGATLIRPAVMFGPDDAFLVLITKLLRRLPLYPMFGNGTTRLQPAYVEDVGEAITRTLERTELLAATFECGGPRVYSYAELLRVIAREAGVGPILMPVPFTAWRALAWVSEFLPKPPLTRNQVDLMQVDNIASPDQPGFSELGLSPRPLEEIIRQVLRDL